MGRRKKRNPSSNVDPEQVALGHTVVSDAQLFSLINKVNPTGRGLPEAKERTRYALKARLQGVLVRQLGDRLSVVTEPGLPAGVVSLRHRLVDCGATHAVLAELEPDARAQVQLILDTGHDSATPSLPATSPVRLAEPSQPARRAHGDHAQAADAPAGNPADASSLLAQGRTALEAYDYDEARRLLAAAVDSAPGEPEPAAALLELCVDHLADYDGALSAARALPPRTAATPRVAELWALAAVRAGETALAEQVIGSHRDGRAAEVRLLIADRALDAGEVGRAQTLAREVRKNSEQQPLEADLDARLVRLEAALQTALSAAGASRVEPLEREATAAFEKQDLERAEQLARQVLASWNGSTVARRMLRDIDERRARRRADTELHGAQQALRAGDHRTAIARFETALAHGASAQTVQPQLQEARRLLREAEHAALVESTLNKMRDADAAAGLAQYLTLNDGLRERVRGLYARPALKWLEELAAAAASKKVQRRACEAVLALERAGEVMGGGGSGSGSGSGAADAAGPPVGASEVLEQLLPHAALINRISHGRLLLQRAQERRSLEEQTEAEGLLHEARQALDRGDLPAAQAALAGLQTRTLQPPLRDQAQELGTTVAALDEAHRIAASFDRCVAKEDLLGARDASQLMVLRSTGDARCLWQKRHQDVCAQIKRTWGVQRTDCGAVGTPGRSLPAETSPGGGARDENGALGAFFDRGWHPCDLSHTLADAQRDVLYLARAADYRVFVATLCWPGGDLRAVASVRTPNRLGSVAQTSLCDRNLWLTGQQGTVLVLSTDDWSVLAWHDFSHWTGDAVVESVTPIPGGRYVWILVSDRVTRLFRALVLDLSSGRICREVDDFNSAQVVCTPNRTIVFDGLLDSARMLTPAGALLSRFDRNRDGDRDRYVPEAVAAIGEAEGGGEIFVSVGREDDGEYEDDEDSPVQVRAITPDGRFGEPVDLDVAHVDAARCVAASREHRIAVVLASAECSTSTMLWGFRVDSDRLTPLYALSVPADSFLAQDETGNRVAMVYYDGARAHIHDLSKGQQPVFDPASAPGPRYTPPPPRGFLLCGSEHAEAEASAMHLVRKVATMHDDAAVAFVESYCTENRDDPIAILALHRAAQHFTVPRERSALLLEHLQSARDRHSDNPPLQLCWATELARQGRWQQTKQCLSRLDAARITDPQEGHYFHHLLGCAQMATGDGASAYASFEAARRRDLQARAQTQAQMHELEEEQEEGRCTLQEHLLLVAPRDSEALMAAASGATASKAEGAEHEREWRRARRANAREKILELRTIVQHAQAAREAGDWERALQSLDQPAVWQADEAQTLARLAEAFLMLPDPGRATKRGPLWGMRKAAALAALCDTRLPEPGSSAPAPGAAYPEGTLDDEEIATLAEQARQWLMAWGTAEADGDSNDSAGCDSAG